MLHSFRPDIVIVQLGTNDLTSCPPLQVGSAIEDFVHLLYDSYGVKGVCVCQTISRRSAVVFNKKVDILTRYLRVVLEPIPYAIYWGHRDFWRARNSFFFSDGTHLNSRGQYKLYRSLRGAVLKLEFLLVMATSNFYVIFHFVKMLGMSLPVPLLLICGPSPILYVSAFDVLF